MYLAAVLAVMWKLYTFCRSIYYRDNQNADCVAPLRIPKNNILNTSRTLYGQYITYDDNMTEAYGAVNIIKTEFDKDPVPDIKGIWYPFVVVGKFDWPMPLDVPALDTYMSTFGWFCKLKTLSVYDSSDYK